MSLCAFVCEENAGPPPSLPPPLRGHIAEGQSLSPDTKAGGRDVEVRDHVKLVLNEVLEREREREREAVICHMPQTEGLNEV